MERTNILRAGGGGVVWKREGVKVVQGFFIGGRWEARRRLRLVCLGRVASRETLALRQSQQLRELVLETTLPWRKPQMKA
jgi:hypothetical protein